MMKIRHRLAVLSAGMLLLAGCGDQQITENIPPNTEPQARFRVLNFISDPRASSVDIVVEGVPYRGAVPYRNLAGANIPYRAILTGQRTFTLTRNGEPTVSLFNGPVNIAEPGQIYSIVFAGSGTGIQPIVLNDGANVPSANQFRVRVVNGSASIGAIDVYVITTAANFATAQPSAAAVAFGGSYSTNRALSTTTRVVITRAADKAAILFDATVPSPAVGGGSATFIATDGATAGTIQVTQLSP